MNNPFDTFIRKLQGVTLSDAAYMRIRERLVSYADMHAVVDGVRGVPTTWASPAWLRTRQSLYALSLVAFIIVSSGGATLAAEGAVPGQALYSMKVGVNEKVGAAWVNTPEERARYNAKLAERRIDEAVMLAEKGTLDTDTALYLDEQVAIHIESSESAAIALEEEGDIATALAVRTDLEAHLALKVTELTEEEVSVADTTSEAAPAEDARVMMMVATKEAPVMDREKTPREEFAERLTMKLGALAEAREHAEAAVLPGLKDAKDRGFDLKLIRDEDGINANNGVIDAADGGLNIEAGGRGEATSTDETRSMKTEPFLAPSGLPEGEAAPFWLRVRR